MKNSLYILFFFAHTFAGYSQSFTTLAPIPGNVNDFHGGLAFEVSGNIYAGGGLYGKKLYRYSPNSQGWTPLKDLPGATYTRYHSIAFTINNTAYIAFGSDIDLNMNERKLKDIWKYNEASDSWTQQPLPPFFYRFAAAVFVLKNKAYIIGGADSDRVATNTVWEFDGNSWLQKADHPTFNIAAPATFTINGQGYTACGFTASASFGNYINDVYKYDPDSNRWEGKASYPGPGRADAFGFNTPGKGYCGLGSALNATFDFVYYSDFYSYNPANNQWTPVSGFPGQPRQQGVNVSLNGEAYFGGGWTFINNNNTYYKDWYKFTEGAAGLNEINYSYNAVRVYPNPSSNTVSLEHFKGNEITVKNILGKVVHIVKLKGNDILDVSQWEDGIYFVTSDRGEVAKLVKQ